MYFYKNLYAGPSIRDPEEVKRKLMRGEGQFTIYVIALSPSIPGPGSNQLEILHCVNLQQPYYKTYPPYIIGIAAGRTEAVERIRKLRGRDVNPALSDKSPLSSGSGAPDTQEEQPKQPQSE